VQNRLHTLHSALQIRTIEDVSLNELEGFLLRQIEQPIDVVAL
jgi:hypothetical protein